MTRPLAPLTPFALVVLLVGCFEPGEDDDEIGSATDDTTADTTGESESDTDSEGSTTAEETEETDETTTEESDETTTEEDTTTGPDCGPEEMACGPDCADLDSNPDHCGACDHSCLGGECTAGTCGIVELATGKGRLFMALVDTDYLYYGGDGTDVGRITLDGTDDTILVPAGADIQQREWCYDSAITPEAVVWGNDWVQPGVRGCTLPDCAGGVQTFVPGLNMYAMAFNEANSTLYWNQGSDIHKRAWPGGMPTVHLAAAGNPRSLAGDEGFVYWAASVGANDIHLRKNPVGGGPFVELVINRPTMGDIEVGPDYVYWAEGPQIYFASLPNGIAGGAPPEFGSSGTSVRFMAIDDTHLYWTSTSADVGSVQRCPLEGCGGAPEVLGQTPQPWGITLDDVAVYWVTEAGGIYKVAK
jgi:hypothetical protein